LRNLIEPGYFPDHRGYRRPKSPGLVTHVLSAQRKPTLLEPIDEILIT